MTRALLTLTQFTRHRLTIAAAAPHLTCATATTTTGGTLGPSFGNPLVAALADAAATSDCRWALLTSACLAADVVTGGATATHTAALLATSATVAAAIPTASHPLVTAAAVLVAASLGGGTATTTVATMYLLSSLHTQTICGALLQASST